MSARSRRPSAVTARATNSLRCALAVTSTVHWWRALSIVSVGAYGRRRTDELLGLDARVGSRSAAGSLDGVRSDSSTRSRCSGFSKSQKRRGGWLDPGHVGVAGDNRHRHLVARSPGLSTQTSISDLDIEHNGSGAVPPSKGTAERCRLLTR